MPSIVVLTGVVGAGKSTLADHFESSAFVVRTDAVQFDAARRAFPFIRHVEVQTWEAWPREPSTMHMNRLLNLSLTSTHPEIFSHRGNVMIEGTITCLEWFHAPLVEEINMICEMESDVDVHYIDLIPSPEVLQRQLLDRGKPLDVKQFTDIANVKQHIQWAEGRTAEGWRRFEDAAEAEQEIRRIFEAD